MINVLDPLFLTEIVRNIRTNINSYRGAQLLSGGVDLKVIPGLTVEYDIVNDDTGMTPPTGLNDPSPIHTAPPIGNTSFTNQEWREKEVIDRETMAKLRQPGNDLERMWGRQYMTERMVGLNGRLETRFEWMRWSVLSGKLIVPATRTKPAITLDYKVPARNKPVAAIPWSDTKNSRPFADVEEWKLLFRGSGSRPKTLLVNQRTDAWLKSNEGILAMLTEIYGRSVTAGSDSMSYLFEKQNNVGYEVYDGGYIAEDKTFYPYIPDGVAILLGEKMVGNIVELVTSPNNYEDLFRGVPGKFALVQEIPGDPKEYSVVNGATVLPRMTQTNCHIYATVGQ